MNITNDKLGWLVTEEALRQRAKELVEEGTSDKCENSDYIKGLTEGHKNGLKYAIQIITDLYPQDLGGLETDWEKGLNHALAAIVRKLHK